ncbi:hypothetical protein AGLY_014807, partial [Aphis glycines]
MSKIVCNISLLSNDVVFNVSESAVPYAVIETFRWECNIKNATVPFQYVDLVILKAKIIETILHPNDNDINDSKYYSINYETVQELNINYLVLIQFFSHEIPSTNYSFHMHSFWKIKQVPKIILIQSLKNKRNPEICSLISEKLIEILKFCSLITNCSFEIFGRPLQLKQLNDIVSRNWFATFCDCPVQLNLQPAGNSSIASEAVLTNLKSRGNLIHPNRRFFKLISDLEKSFKKYCNTEHLQLIQYITCHVISKRKTTCPTWHDLFKYPLLISIIRIT